MKKQLGVIAVAIAVGVIFGDTLVRAANATVLIVLPAAVSNTAGVLQDAATGFQHGSLKATGVGKSEAYFTPESQLNGREIALSDIASISYYTKKSTDHVASPGDWYINVYTKPYTGDISSATWYGDRIGAEPYFARNLTETVGGWNQWSSDEPVNQLRFFESTSGYFGSYVDSDWATFLQGSALSGHSYATRKVHSFSVQTASSWGIGFEGQIDGLRIELTDGTVMKFNFEPFVVPSDKDGCKKDGWMSVLRPNGSPFSEQGDCVSYVSAGR